MSIFEKMNPFKNQSEMLPGDDVPERVAERSFSSMNPEKEITEESNAEEIIEKVRSRHENDSINPICFFKFKGADLKIGDLKSLGKLMYEIKIGDVVEAGHELYSHENIEETISLILKKADEFITKEKQE